VGLVSVTLSGSETTFPPAAVDARRADVRITALEAIPFAVPYRRPAGFASGTVTTADNVLVRVHTDAGLVGQAEAQPRPYTYGETQTSIVHTVRATLEDLLVGLNPLDTEAVNARCARIAGNHVARGAVDLAVWDLVGKVLDRPCHTLLGGYACDVAAAHMVSFGSPETMAEDALDVHDRLGVRTFKVKVGREPDLDVAATRAIRDALPDADLYVDANRGWSYDDALRAGDALLDLGVRAIEEPISVDDRAGRLRLAERWPVPLVGDESCISLAHVDRALEEGAVRAVSVKTARTGFTESRRIVDLCVARSTPVVVGSQYEGATGALATIAFAAAFAATADRPAEFVNFLDLADDLVVGPPEIRDGRAAAPDAAGIGVEIDEERLQRYRVDG
jgi:L-alanine-DL-glutamate epimerase-like enolase superfamily enzyme